MRKIIVPSLVLVICMMISMQAYAQWGSGGCSGGTAILFNNIMADDLKTVRETLAKSPELVNTADAQGVTPLYVAAATGKEDIARLLLGKGAQVNSKTNEGATPLHAAVYANNEKIVRLLLSKGAAVDVKDKSGATPLALAETKGFTNIAAILKKYGVK
jgi:ankyrin repeat protein